MKTTFNAISALLILASLTFSCKQNKPQSVIPPIIPLEDFFRNPERSGYAISPDGSHFAYMAPYESRMNIFVQKIEDTTAIRLTGVTDRDLYYFFWANNNQIVYGRDNAGDENYQIYIVNIDGSGERNLTPFAGTVNEIIDDLEEDEKGMLVSSNKRIAEIFDIYYLNLESGEMKMVAENPGNITGWYTDHDGKIRLASTTDGVNTSLLYRATENDAWKEIIKTDFREGVSPIFFTFDNRNLYASSNIGRDKSAFVIIDLETGKEIEKIFEHEEVDVSGATYSRKRKVLTSVRYTTSKPEKKFFDAEMEKLYGRLEKELQGYQVAITSINRDEDKMLVRTYSDRTQGAYYFYDKTNDKLSHIIDVTPWIKENDMAEMTPVQYPARDGQIIHGYLTLPVGRVAKNLPVVINPHGGPWARDGWGYNPEVQFLANRGYAVLQMNFRGSVGYGREFWEKSFKQWGKTMQDDVSDGVKWLIEKGIADPNRVAIYGASYGGYATLAGLTFTPELYAAGVDYVGVSNLFTFMKTIPPYWKPYLEMMYTMVGNPEQDSLMMREASPVFHVDKIKAPLFVAQGRMDPRVNVDESDQIVKALRDRGVEVEYMVKDNEGHGFSNEENQFEFYRAMEKFLDKHLKSEKTAKVN